jgi:hypothetical protein
MQRETPLSRRILLAASAAGARLWRNNQGVAVYPDGSRTRYGVGDGGSDYIGYVLVPSGRVRRPVFAAVEVKTATGKLRDNQRMYLEGVARDGGLAIVARDPDEVRRLVSAASDGDESVLGKVHGL